MLKRLKEYIDFKGIPIARFEKSIGMSNASFGKSLKNGGSIGADKLEIILITYPDINLEWLITGKGYMLKDPHDLNKNSPPGCELCREKDKIIKDKEKIITAQETTIDAQTKTIETLSRLLKTVDTPINKKSSSQDEQKRKVG